MKSIGQSPHVRSRVVITVALLGILVVFSWLFGDLAVGYIRALSRCRETLPAISIENERTVYCRMRSCDFRFPLPDDARVKWIDPVKGDFDTTKGVLYLETQGGRAIDVLAYANLLERNRFQVEQRSAWQLEARSTKPEGGRVTIETSNGTAKIYFSYFGDY